MVKNFKDFKSIIVLHPSEVREILLQRQAKGKPFMVVRNFADSKHLEFISATDIATQELALKIKARVLKIVLIADQVEYILKASELLMRSGESDFILIAFGKEDLCLLPYPLWAGVMQSCKQCERFLLRKGVNKKERKAHLNQHLLEYLNKTVEVKAQ